MIAIITVVYNNYEVLDDLFKTLNKQTNQDFHLFVTDASTERKSIEKQSFDMSVIPIKNKGYAHGVNIGIQQALEKNITKFCVINDDVYLDKAFVKNVAKSFNDHPHSLFGGKIYYAPGYEYHKNSYTNEEKGHVIWYAGGTVDWNHALTYHRGVDEVDKGQYDNKESTGFITGCLICFDIDVINEIGYWDESYFLYYEDADYCERAKKNDIDLCYVPTIKLWHKNAQSTEGPGSKLHQKFQNKARLRFALKFAPWRTKVHVLKNYFINQNI